MHTPHPRRAKVSGDLFHPAVPADAIYAGRRGPKLPSSPYANPHRVDKPCKQAACRGALHDRAEALRLYEAHLDARPDIVRQAAAEPTDASFACRCPLDKPCHVDVLLRRVDQLRAATSTYAFTPGQTVRWSARLRADWHGSIPVGRITDQYPTDAYCGLCDTDGRNCPGPWYGVDFTGALGAGVYGEHELEAA